MKTEQSEVLTEASKPIVEDLVCTPAGWLPRSEIIVVQSGHRIEHGEDKISIVNIKTGEVVEEMYKTTEKKVQEQSSRKVKGHIALPGGWELFAQWNNTSSNPINQFKSTWIVPPPPVTNTGQVLFVFNALQDTNHTTIIQPVLQWGSNVEQVGGGNYWAVACWYIVEGYPRAMVSPLTRVQTGTQLTGIIEKLGGSGNQNVYGVYFDGQPNASLIANNSVEMTQAYVALETYDVKLCSDYPATTETQVLGIEIVVGNSPQNIVWQVHEHIVACGQSMYVQNGIVTIVYPAKKYAYVKQPQLNEQSNHAPVICQWKGVIYMVWSGKPGLFTTEYINIIPITNNGTDVQYSQKYEDRSDSTHNTLATAVLENNSEVYLYIAWAGTDTELNVITIPLPLTSGSQFTKSTYSSFTSDQGPSLTPFDNDMFMAFTGTDGQLNVINLSNLSGTVIPEHSRLAPALVAFGGRIYIAWTGTDGRLNIMYSLSGKSFGNGSQINVPITFNLYTNQAPFLSTDGTNVWITWVDANTNEINLMVLNYRCQQQGEPITLSAETAFGGGVPMTYPYFAWTGTDTTNSLNIARLVIP